MTVLHYVGYDDDRGGIVSVVRALSAEKRFQCILGVNTGFVQRRVPPLETLELPTIPGEAINLRTLWRARAIARTVHAWLRADPKRIFHGHSRAGLLVALWLVRGGERRVVVSVHCHGRQKWFYRWAARQLDRRLYWLTPEMRRYYGVGGEGWYQCIPTCVAPKLIKNPSGAHFNAENNVLVLGGAGALVPWKGWHWVIDALAQLPAAIRERFRFIHFGSAPAEPGAAAYAEALRRKVETRGVAHLVEWRGEQPSTEALWPQLDCLVIPSENEPFSAVMLEALWAGVPVLRADSGGAVNVIVSGENGWLFRTGDAADLARALRALVETDALRRLHIDRSRIERFSASVVAEQWAAVYAQCIQTAVTK